MDGVALPETRSTCAYCGVGCGVMLRPDGQGTLYVRGDQDHPANFGKLCSKGLALGDTVALEGRLLAPRVDGHETSWDAALDLVAGKFRATIAEHGPDSVAFYVSGQLLTEDYYIANKLIKGFMGTANIDTNSRLCMASTVAGHKRAFGTDTVPGTYEDLDEADLVVLVGSNLAWCHPVLYQRVMDAQKARGTKIVVIDPRRTASCDKAEQHLPLAPGSDVALFNGLLHEIARRDKIDRGFIENVEGLDAAMQAARETDLAVTGLNPDDLQRFYDLWIGTEKVVTIFSQGVNQSTSGSDKVNAILNCHLATGRIGRPGLGPFSVTGQPNAMGGREVGGLANMLACHLDIENEAHRHAVQSFWSAPTLPVSQGLKAVDMFQAIGSGKIKALWVIHTNPVVSMPDANAVRAAIENCFTVVSDITANTDTAALADVLLPATAWAEKNGMVTNSDRTISRQRAVLPVPGRARPDWDILAEVGRRMGWGKAFDYKTEAEIFREFAALSGVAAGLGKDFDISGLADLSEKDYAAFTPRRWPVSQKRQGGRFFADGKFFHADQKARMLPVQWKPPAALPTAEFPFVLNTGRNRDQWHTMTRTARSARLASHLAEPYVEIHPDDAAKLSIDPADLVLLKNDLGQSILRAKLTDGISRGQVFTPIHWTGQTAPSGRIDVLVAPKVDPVSGQPESKAAVVSVQKFAADWYGFAVSQSSINMDTPYWALAKTNCGYRAEFAGHGAQDWEQIARQMFDLPHADVQLVSDTANHRARIAFFDAGRLVAALFISPEPVAVMRDHLAALPGQEAPHVLTGQAPLDQPNTGPVLCSCFNVGVNTIVCAIEEQGLMTVEAIGEALQAGTNCGSCRPELSDILQGLLHREAAE